MSTYVPIQYEKFKTMMDKMNFVEIQLDGTFERVWKYEIVDADLTSRYDIRVYSTIGGEISRAKGKDAIRCMIYDKVKNKILKLEKRVHRTISALTNTRERCRDLYKHIKKNRCSCGGILLTRESKVKHKFMGCSNYPICKNSKNIIVPQLKLNLKN
jgi:hypothetical protein